MLKRAAKRRYITQYFLFASVVLGLLANFILISFSTAWAQNGGFNYADFNSVAGLNLVGSAAQAGDRVRLTPTLNDQSGAMWHATRQNVEEGFTTTFRFQITNPGGIAVEPGADGIALVIQNSSDVALGGFGEAIGYGGIANSLAVEFDTFNNPWLGDPNNNHISVQTNGTGANSADHAYSLGVATNVADLSDGTIHTAAVEYEPGLMKVFLDDLTNPVLTANVNLSTLLSLDNGNAWIGLTSGTGDSWEEHDLLSWSFAPAVSSDLAVSKAVDNATPDVGAQVVFTVTLTNNGPDAAGAFEVSDPPPGGLTFDSVIPSSGSYDPATGNWSLPGLPVGATESLTVLATVHEPGMATNTATILAADPDNSNNSASASVEGQAADLGLSKGVDSPVSNPGEQVTFTLTISNSGPSTATGVELLEPAPTGLLFASMTPSQGSYDENTGIWSVGDLANGSSATLTIVATVEDLCAINSATIINSSPPDLAPQNDTASAGSSLANLWTNPLGGNWSDGANWSAGVPDAGSAVCITFDATYTVNLDVNATVNSLTLGTSGGSNNQTLSIAGGRKLALNQESIINRQGILSWSNGTIATSAGKALRNAGTIAMSSTSNKILNPATLINEGATTWNAGTFWIENGSTFVNEGLFEMQSDNAIDDFGTGPNTFINSSTGILRKSAGSANSTILNNIILENWGLVEAQSGTIRLQSNANHTDATLVATAISSSIRLDAGTHTISGTLSGTPVGAVFMDTGSSLRAAEGGALLNFGGSGFQWQGGSILGGNSGGGPIANGGLLVLSTTSNKILDFATTLTNQGTTTWNGGTFWIEAGSTFVNEGLFQMQSDNSINPFDIGPNTFVNAAGGIVTKNGGTGSSTFSSGLIFDNQGVLETQSGTISLNGNSFHTDAQLAASAGAAIRLNAGTHTISGTLSGAPAGAVFMDTGSSLQAVPGGATLNFAGAGFDWQGGNILGGNTLTNAGLLLLSTSSDKVIDFATTLANTGTVQWNGGNFWIEAGSTFVNEGLFEMFGDNSIRPFDTGPNTFLNAAGGIFRKSGGAGNSTIATGLIFENQSGGMIDATSGTLDFNSNFHHAQGALIQGIATVDVLHASLTNSGITEPGQSAGTLTWIGSYSPSPTAELHIELGGLAAGSEHDQLVVTGTATLSGTISASLINGFTPADGDSFTILTATSVSGSFANETIDLGDGLVLHVVYNPTNVTFLAEQLPLSIELTPVNEPIIIPPGGGSYQYDAQVTNHSDEPLTFHAWVVIEGPGGLSRTFGPLTLTLQPGQSASRRLTQQVPGAAPAGSYSHTGFVGGFPNNVIDSDSLSWEKAAGMASGRLFRGWQTDLDEWPHEFHNE